MAQACARRSDPKSPVPVIVATIVPLPGQIDAAEEVFKSIIPQVHTEDGCELYALHRSADKLVFVERWRDGDGNRRHDG